MTPCPNRNEDREAGERKTYMAKRVIFKLVLNFTIPLPETDNRDIADLTYRGTDINPKAGV